MLYTVRRGEEIVIDELECQPDISAGTLLEYIKESGVWCGEYLSFAKEENDHGFDLVISAIEDIRFNFVKQES